METGVLDDSLERVPTNMYPHVKKSAILTVK